MKQSTFIQKAEAARPDCTVIGTYTNSSNRILVRHDSCGRTWEPFPYHFLRGSKCPHCERERKERKSSGIDNIVNIPDDFIMLEPYRGSNVSIRFRHSCGLEFNIKPKHFLEAGCHCPSCGKTDITIGQAQERLDQLDPNWEIVEFSSLVRYSKIRCRTCGNIQAIRLGAKFAGKSKKTYCHSCIKKATIKRKNAHFWAQYSRYSTEHTKPAMINGKIIPVCRYCGNRLPCHCSGKRRTINKEKFNEIFVDKIRDYKPIGEYIDSFTPIEFKHLTCGTRFIKRPVQVIKYHKLGKESCPSCMKKRGTHKTNKQVQNELDRNFGKGTFILLNDYQACDKPILVKHSCGHEYWVRADRLLQNNSVKYRGNACPACSNSIDSIGAQRIENWLRDNGLKFKKEYIIPELGKLRFDFAVFYNGLHLIEFDGQQHYEPIEYFGGEYSLSRQQARDKQKNTYCYEHKISLLRIPWLSIDYIDSLLDTEMFGLRL